MHQLKHATFPPNFIFGVADADLQVIGEQNCLDNEDAEPTLWTSFAQNSGKVFQNEPPLTGIDRYHRWEEDMQTLKSLGVRHYRTSVSIFRMLSRSGDINEKAVDWYRTYFSALKKEGISLYVTLYHWDMPMFLAEKGGWKNRDMIDWLVKHALAVQERLGDLIDEYFILNEPFQFTLLSHHLGEHAPGETDLKGALQAVHHALVAQGRVLRAMKKVDPTVVIGTVYNSRAFYADSNSKEDLEARQLAEEYQTRIFLDPLYLGEYPALLQEKLAHTWPEIQEGDMDEICVGSEMNMFGLNYYRGMTIKADSSNDIGFAEVQYEEGVQNGLGWPVYIPPVYPEGLYDLLRELTHRYGSYGLSKIYISESGTCSNDVIQKDGSVPDPFRISFFKEHFTQIQKAILAGVPIEGFFLWSLMDNYEWEMAYKPGSNFGIVHVDRQTLERTPKDSFYWYKDVIDSHKF